MKQAEKSSKSFNQVNHSSDNLSSAMSWRKVKLGELLTESKVPCENPNTDRRIKVRLKVLGVEKRGLENEIEGATKQYIRKAGQFIYGKQNFHKGAFGIIPKELDGFESSADLPAFDVSKNCLPEWIFYFFKQGNYYLQLSKIARGVATQRIHPEQIYDLEIPLPDLKTQKEFLANIYALENQGEELETELIHQQDLLKQLRQAFLREAMQGKLLAKANDEFEINVPPDKSGGNSSGDNSSGSNSPGGNSSGGNSSGDNSSGDNSSGGNSSGGNSSGGNSSGGNSSGGNSSGGNSSGGNSSGGNSSGDNSSGGNSSGGNSSGDNSSGGNSSGGNSKNQLPPALASGQKEKQAKGFSQTGKELLEQIKKEKEKLMNCPAFKGRAKEKSLPPIKEEDIPFDIPENWVWCRLGEIVEMNRGRFSIRPRNDPSYFGGKFPFIQIGSLDENGSIIYEAPQSLNEKGFKVSKCFPKGTIVIAIVGGTIGNLGVLGVEMCFTDSMVGIYPTERYCQDYVLNFLRFKQPEIKEASYQMSGQPNIKIPTLENLIIPLPPLAEQKRIVKKLEELMNLCDELKTTITNNQTYSNQLLQVALKDALQMKEVEAV